jgi:hypothetical protein
VKGFQLPILGPVWQIILTSAGFYGSISLYFFEITFQKQHISTASLIIPYEPVFFKGGKMGKGFESLAITLTTLGFLAFSVGSYFLPGILQVVRISLVPCPFKNDRHLIG